MLSADAAISYFDHDADIGIIGYGESITQAFVAAAKAVFAVMADLQHVQLTHAIAIEFVEDDVELALVTWLNLLIAEARSHGLVFAQFFLTQVGNKWQGEAQGQLWNDNLPRGTEVKGATLTMLSVKKNADVWEARCIVDV